MYRQYANRSGRADAVLPLIGCLGRLGRLEEALVLCDRAWRTCPAGAVASVAVALVSVYVVPHWGWRWMFVVGAVPA